MIAKVSPGGWRCAHCNYMIRAGQIMLTHRVKGRGLVTFHRKCIEAVLESAPLDDEVLWAEHEKVRDELQRGALS